MYVAVTDASFAQDVVEASRRTPVVLYFWASWCAPCRVMGPILERMAERAAGRWALAKVGAEAEPALTERCEINALPALQLYMGGAMVAEFVDLLPETKLNAWLEQSILRAVGNPPR